MSNTLKISVMKTSVIFFSMLLTASVAFGQEQKLNEIKVTAPQFRNEIFHSANDFLEHSVEFPAKSKNAGLQGTEVIQFTVTTEGQVTDFMVINSVSTEIDLEVIRILEVTNGKWTPGTVNGEPVAMTKEVSVVFKNNPATNFAELANKHLQKGNQALFVKNQPEKALKYFNRGITLLPNDETLLVVRGLCKYKLGDETGASRDWDRFKVLAERNGTTTEIENLAIIPENTREHVELLRALQK
jgi:tetratricopeptide (TPR) repeat protein